MNPARATELVNLGFNLLPIKVDGSKKPDLPSWMHLKTERTTQAEILQWGEDFGAAVVCGKISGNLEILDIDDASWLEAYLDQVDQLGGMSVFNRLTIAITPRPGYHLYYRCNEIPIPGNQKLAYDEPAPNDNKPRTKIETRGEGGYALLPGSPASVHKSNRLYELYQGTFEGIPVITAAEREILLQAARSLTRWVPIKAPDWKVVQDKTSKALGRPGDRFNEQNNWLDVLRPHGWEIVKTHGRIVYWRQPQKENKGHSATTGFAGQDILYVFSSNCAPFEPSTGYTKFTAHAYLNHGGNFPEAAKSLIEEGYGVKAPPITNTNVTDLHAPDAGLPGDDTPLEYTEWNHGKRFARDWHDLTKYNPQFHWCTYKNGIYRPKSDAIATELAKITAQRFYNSIDSAPMEKRVVMERVAKKLHSVDGLAKMLTMARTEEGIRSNIDDFDGPQYHALFNCKNYIIDLNSGEPMDHSPSMLLTKQSNVMFDPKATCPLFDECLKMWFEGDDEMIDFWWRWVGYTLSGFTHYEHFVFLEGPGGNGKTIARETIVSLMGSYVRTMPKSALMTNQNDQMANMTRAVGARMLAATEVNKGDRLDEGRVKDLVSGELQPAKLLFCDGFDFKPIGKLWMHGNHRPTITDTTESIWRRLLVVPFYVIIPPEKRDPNLRFKTLLELPGILNKAIAGYQRQASDSSKKFKTPTRVLNTSQDYRDQMDTIKLFMDESNDDKPAPDDRVRVTYYYHVYNQWCHRSNKKPLSADAFARDMTKRGFQRKKIRNVWWYLGIALKPQFRVSDEEQFDDYNEQDERDEAALRAWEQS